MNKRKAYKDMDKLRAYRKRDNKRYYGKTNKTATNRGKSWTNEETAIVLFSPHTDTEIALKLKRSIRAVQLRRTRCKNDAGSYYMYWNGKD